METTMNIHVHTHTHTYTQYTQTQWNIIQYKKEWNSAMCSNMDGPKDYQTKWSRLERERQISYHLYAESKIWNKLTYLQNINRHTDIEKRLVVAKEEDSGSLTLTDANYDK